MAKGGGGESLGGDSGKPLNIINTQDMLSYMKEQGNEDFGNEAMQGVKALHYDFPGLMDDINEIQAAKLGGSDKDKVLGYYDGSNVALNENFTNVEKMNSVYDVATAQNYHPSRGDKSGVEAVALHEMGHALNDRIAKQNGVDMDTMAKTIVDNAYKNSRGRGGTKAWAKGISGYAQDSNAECIAEAVSDYYCNGSNASAQSKAIYAELQKQYKK